MKCLVILINYHGFSDTMECIESIRESTFVPDILVVDNSMDLCDYNNFLKVNNIIVIKEENNGFASANNIGFQYAISNGYDSVIVLNNDTVVDCNMFDYMLSNLDDNCVISPCMYYYNNRNDVWFCGGTINRFQGRSLHYCYYRNNNFYCDYLTGCCFAISTRTLKKVGMFNESYFMYCEDFDYSIKLARNNVRILVVPKAKLFHKVSKSTGKKSPFSIYYFTRNRILNVRNNKDYFSKFAIYFLILIILIKMFIYFFGDKKIYFSYKKGLFDGLNNIKGRAI